MELFESIGARLREERKRIGLSQSDVAEIAADQGAAGTTRQSQSLYEKDKRIPDAAYLAAIEQAGFNINYVVTGSREYPAALKLSNEEAALLDNYRNSPEEQQRLLRETSAAFAQSNVKKGKVA